MSPPVFQPFEDDQEHTPSDQARAKLNHRQVLEAVVQLADAARAPTPDRVARWHHDLLEGLSYVPDPCYLGAYRGSAHSWLRDYEVEIRGLLGPCPGVAAHQVADALERYFSELVQRIHTLEQSLPRLPDKSSDNVQKVAALAAWAHGEWVRIHPFANGNGRTARLLANYVLARFCLLPVVRLRPRPDYPYGLIAEFSMKGQHELAQAWILSLLEAASS